MKISAKPILSPNRASTDTFPAPLFARLRSNGRSNSRRRSLRKSLSSPMLRKKSTSIETQEPSSPKVTCIGQVRIKSNPTTTSKRGYWGFKNQGLFCNCFSGKWASSRKSKAIHSSSSPINVWRRFVMGSHGKVEIDGHDGDERRREEDGKKTQLEEAGSLAPRNALLLMRSRSEPLRASSLANRIWGSPVKEETGQEKKEESEPSPPPPPPQQIEIGGHEGDHNRQISDRGDASHEEDHHHQQQPSRIQSRSMKVSECYWVSSRDGCGSESYCRIVKNGVDGEVVLRRCKSEPARRQIQEDDK